MKYKDLIILEENSVIHEMPGWGYFANLKSGWKAAFFTGNTMTEHFPGEYDEIKAIYKY
ncbi:MAG: hypothetical protein LBJ31_08125 [Treponema sp.]|jgi:hypothetical protein|nr:hypothetical protein [Treponema sp.]